MFKASKKKKHTLPSTFTGPEYQALFGRLESSIKAQAVVPIDTGVVCWAMDRMVMDGDTELKAVHKALAFAIRRATHGG